MAKKEYIEREAALSAQNKSMNLSECRKRLERIPAADVVEVRQIRAFIDRLIDGDAAVQMLMRIGDRKYRRSNGTLSDAIKILGSSVYTPTVDAAPVCRCKDCELWNDWDSAGKESLGNYVCSCAHWSVEDGAVLYTRPTDYCSYGERKGGDEDGQG